MPSRSRKSTNRSRSLGSVTYVKDHFRQGIDPPGNGREERVYPKGFESISSQNGRGFINRCDHIRHEISRELATHSAPSVPNGGVVTTYVNEDYAAATPAPYFDPEEYWISPSLADFRRKVLENDQLNLFVALAEFKDIPVLLSSLFGLLAKFRPDSVWLTYKLGLTPLVSDAKKLYELFTQFDKHIKRLERLDGKEVRVNLRNQTTFQRESPKMTLGYTGYVHSYKGTVSMFAGCRARIRLPRLGSKTSQILERINIEADRFGLTPDLSDFWELIPFSFIIDWFFPIGDILNDLNRDASSIQVDLWNFSQSVKLEYEGSTRIVEDNLLSGTLVGFTQYRCSGKRFHRQPFLASTFQSFRTDLDIDLSQLATLGSLITSKVL